MQHKKEFVRQENKMCRLVLYDFTQDYTIEFFKVYANQKINLFTRKKAPKSPIFRLYKIIF